VDYNTQGPPLIPPSPAINAAPHFYWKFYANQVNNPYQGNYLDALAYFHLAMHGANAPAPQAAAVLVNQSSVREPHVRLALFFATT